MAQNGGEGPSVAQKTQNGTESPKWLNANDEDDSLDVDESGLKYQRCYMHL